MSGERGRDEFRNDDLCPFYLALPVASITPIGAAPRMRPPSAAPPPTPAVAPEKR